MKQPNPAKIILPISPIPNQRIKKGTNATGGTGRIASIGGSNNPKIILDRLMTIPTTIPIIEPSK